MELLRCKKDKSFVITGNLSDNEFSKRLHAYAPFIDDSGTFHGQIVTQLYGKKAMKKLLALFDYCRKPHFKSSSDSTDFVKAKFGPTTGGAAVGLSFAGWPYTSNYGPAGRQFEYAIENYSMINPSGACGLNVYIGEEDKTTSVIHSVFRCYTLLFKNHDLQKMQALTINKCKYDFTDAAMIMDAFVMSREELCKIYGTDAVTETLGTPNDPFTETNATEVYKEIRSFIAQHSLVEYGNQYRELINKYLGVIL